MTKVTCRLIFTSQCSPIVTIILFTRLESVVTKCKNMSKSRLQHVPLYVSAGVASTLVLL